MPIERERKWILPNDIPTDWEHDRWYEIEQAYVTRLGNPHEVRVRRQHRPSAGSEFTLTVKSTGDAAYRTQITTRIERKQFEMLWRGNAHRQIRKKRFVYPLNQSNTELEVDVFKNVHGLKVGEIEFPTEEKLKEYDAPDWFGREVTRETRFKNHWIATNGNPL